LRFKALTRKEDVSDDLFAFWSRAPESGQMMKVAWLSRGGQLLIYQSFRMPVSSSTPSVELLDPHIGTTLANGGQRSELTRVVWLRAICLSATRDVAWSSDLLIRPAGKQDALASGSWPLNYGGSTFIGDLGLAKLKYCKATQAEQNISYE
jgi:hypothetical protein